MITTTYTKTHTKFRDNAGNTFTTRAIWNPNEENDPWVRYTKDATGQEYTCRLEAFLARFSVTPE